MDALIGKITDPWYWLDSLPAIVITLGVIGILVILEGIIAGIWNALIQFFAQTQEPMLPVTNPGPSPFTRFLTCLTSMFILILLIAVAVIIGFSMLGFIQW